MLINFPVWIIAGGMIGWLAGMIMRRNAPQGILLNAAAGSTGQRQGVMGSFQVLREVK